MQSEEHIILYGRNMIWLTVTLSEDGEVNATAKGHATNVVVAFHDLVGKLLDSRGAWRITFVNGVAPTNFEALDSDMLWNLTAHSKDRGV